MSHHVEDIRNIALVGHGASGKTSLADDLLFHAHMTNRIGNPDDGTSLAAFDEEEKKRKFSIDTSVLYWDHLGHRVHLLDTPGYPDFIGASLPALDAVENAVLVISAAAGIQVNTRKMFREAKKKGLACFVVINKMDADNIDFEHLRYSLVQTFGQGCVLFNAPIGVGPDFNGVVSVINPPAQEPTGCLVKLADCRTELIQALAEADEALAEKFLMDQPISHEEMVQAIPKAIKAGHLIPVFCTSVKKDLGIDELLDGLNNLALSPKEGKRPKVNHPNGHGLEEIEIEPCEEAPFLARVFKTYHDKFLGNVSFLKILSGKVNPHQPWVNERNSLTCKNSGFFLVQGKQQTPITEAVAGDIIAINKFEDLHIGDTVGTAPGQGTVQTDRFPMPMYGLAVEPKNRTDEQKISSCLHKVAEEDPTFTVERDGQTKEMVIHGISQLHLDVIQSRLKRRFDLELKTHEPKIPYRETILTPGEGDFRHKKQTGGHGQFAEVHVRIYPLPRSITNEAQFFQDFANKAHFEKIRKDNSSYDPVHNFGFMDSVVGGTIPNNFIPAVEKGCREVLVKGSLAGYWIQDVAVEAYFGKDHPVDSSEQAFRIAARKAFRLALSRAKSVLLEPIVNVEVTCPLNRTGEILGLLNTKRARIENQEPQGQDMVVIQAKAPLGELSQFAAEMGKTTAGQGYFSMEFSHYEPTPPLVQQQIMAKASVVHDDDD